MCTQGAVSHRPFKHLVWLLLLLVACEQNSAPAATSATSAASVAASAAPSAAATSKPTTLSSAAQLFAGPPTRDSVGHRPMRIPGTGKLWVRIAPKWQLEEGDALLMHARDRRAGASLQAGFDKVSQGDVDAAAKAIGFENVAWGDRIDAQLGADKLPGTITEGVATLGGERAQIWFLDVEIADAKRLLIVTGGQLKADDARAALIDCMRSVHVGK